MIKVIAHFNTLENTEQRSIFLAACNKLNYIVERIGKNEKVEIISASNTTLKLDCPKKEKFLSDNVKLTLLKGYARGGWLTSKISTLKFRFQLHKYLKKNIKSNDTILVYHSLSLINIIKKIKKKTHCKLILEVEEIYGDVLQKQSVIKREEEFFKLADAYIFPTELLNEKINLKNKPNIIIHGTYNVEKQIEEKFDDGRIHCVYAGTFDPRKGGVAAAAAAQFLTDKYHVHIIGFGSESDTKLLINTIEEISKTTKCKITYDGLLKGEEYIKFIQKCHIGLSTQNPNATFNDTSFPSKVLSYMANGLRVVSIRIKALELSAVNDLIYYYDENNAEKIAEAIVTVNIDDDYDSRKFIFELDKNFKEALIEVL